jgi:putative transposase
MSNHVHLILVPADADGLRAALADANRRYSRRINFAHGWTGYLWQGRFASYPMDDAHLIAAIRYVERNPVATGLVEQAEAWRWSSARAHAQGSADSLTDITALAGIHENWSAMLRYGAEAGSIDDAGEALIEAAMRTGRPIGDDGFIARLEAVSGRVFKKRKPGPKPRHDTAGDEASRKASRARVVRNAPASRPNRFALLDTAWTGGAWRR